MKARPAAALGRKRGSVAVEMAALLPVLIVLLAFPLLLGRIFWHYSTVQSAAHDAARYLSTVPIAEMNNPTRAMFAAALARDIAAAEVIELSGGDGFPVSITISCDDGNCDQGVPAVVTALVRVRMVDPFFGGFTWASVGDNGLPLRAKVVMRYAGQ